MYRHCPPIRVKYTKMSEIEDTSCVRNVMRLTPVSGIEREPWGASSILRRVNDGFYICTCWVRSDEYKCKTKHNFFLTVTSNLCTNQNFVGISLIIELIHLFLFWRINKEIKSWILYMPWNISLVDSTLWNMSTK